MFILAFSISAIFWPRFSRNMSEQKIKELEKKVQALSLEMEKMKKEFQELKNKPEEKIASDADWKKFHGRFLADAEFRATCVSF
jgi:uncharacterized protein YoxC